VRDDLQFSGHFWIWSARACIRRQYSTQPSELRNLDWIQSARQRQHGGFRQRGGVSDRIVAIQAWLYDVRNPASQAVVGKIYRGIRHRIRKSANIAHQFADEIISKLSGGLPGVAGTQIAFVSSRGGSKEIWAMDYDGANQHPVTSLHSIALTPRWSLRTLRASRSPAFPRTARSPARKSACTQWMPARCCLLRDFRGTKQRPRHGTPDGAQIVFLIFHGGQSGIVGDGCEREPSQALTFFERHLHFAGMEPQDGANQLFTLVIAVGVPKLYSYERGRKRIPRNLILPDQRLSGRSGPGRRTGNCWRSAGGDRREITIFIIMDVATRQIIELTRDSGRNERPSWRRMGVTSCSSPTTRAAAAADLDHAGGRFASPSTDDTAGHNESPNWSPR